MTASAAGTPISVRSNSPRPGTPAASISPATSRFVLVPMSVVMPPTMEAYESGIISFDGDTPALSHQACTRGISIATSGVLLRKAESVAVVSMICPSRRRRRGPAGRAGGR